MYKCVSIHTHTHMHTHIHTAVLANGGVISHAGMHNIYIRMCVYIYIYTHTHTHIYMHNIVLAAKHHCVPFVYISA